jgi:LL-H family phage holin
MKFFVDNAQTIFTLAGALIIYIYHLVAVHIPAEKRKYAERFAANAVAFVEQKYAGDTSEEKKAIAMNAIKGFFKDFNLPAPDDATLSKLIEAAVNALHAASPPENPPQIRRASL